MIERSWSFSVFFSIWNETCHDFGLRASNLFINNRIHELVLHEQPQKWKCIVAVVALSSKLSNSILDNKFMILISCAFIRNGLSKKKERKKEITFSILNINMTGKNATTLGWYEYIITFSGYNAIVRRKFMQQCLKMDWIFFYEHSQQEKRKKNI